MGPFSETSLPLSSLTARYSSLITLPKPKYIFIIPNNYLFLFNNILFLVELIKNILIIEGFEY